MGPMLKPSDGSVLYFYGWAGPPATVVVAYAVSTVGSASNNNRVLAQFIRGGSGTNARRVFQIMMANAASAGLPRSRSCLLSTTVTAARTSVGVYTLGRWRPLVSLCWMK